MPEVVAVIAERSGTNRSRVTNGKRLLPGVDGRTVQARRYRDLSLALADECGGAAALTETDKALIRQGAALQVRSETMHAALLNGEEVDGEQLTRLANALSRTLSALGRKRTQKPTGGSTLAQYLAGRAKAATT